MTTVCARDGVAVGQSRGGKLVHLGELPQEMPAHDVVPINPATLARTLDRDEALVSTATDMLIHHASLHPETGCEWAENLERALRAE